MSRERAIDLQLIKPIEVGVNSKGKITIKKLFKEELNKLGVAYIDPCCDSNYNNSFFVVVDTYADMIQQAVGNQYKRFLVLNDEDKGQEKTTYDYWPKIAINWIAAVEDIDLT